MDIPGPNERPAHISFKSQKAIADYKKAIGRADGMAELSIFYCEEAFGILESCSIEDESYFAALIRMYGRSIEFVSRLSASIIPRATSRRRRSERFWISSRRLRSRHNCYSVCTVIQKSPKAGFEGKLRHGSAERPAPAEVMGRTRSIRRGQQQ
jgi:hypothetical protein